MALLSGVGLSTCSMGIGCLFSEQTSHSLHGNNDKLG